jgi:two-component system sensor histidine kinase BarA
MTEQVNPIDWQQCLNKASNDAETAKAIITMFINDLNEAFPKIQQAWEEENYDELRAHIHKLYGGSCYTGIPKMTDVLEQLEANLKNPQTAVVGPLLRAFFEEKELMIQHFNEKTFAKA